MTHPTSNSSSSLPNEKRDRVNESAVLVRVRDRIPDDVEEEECKDTSHTSSSTLDEPDSDDFTIMIESVVSSTIERSTKRRRETPCVPMGIFSSRYTLPPIRHLPKTFITSDPSRATIFSTGRSILPYTVRGASNSCIDIIDRALDCIEKTCD